jgi:hypothetical protein
MVGQARCAGEVAAHEEGAPLVQQHSLQLMGAAAASHSEAAREIDASKQELQATREQLPTTQDELTSTKMQLMDAWQQIKAIRGRCTRAPTFV